MFLAIFSLDDLCTMHITFQLSVNSVCFLRIKGVKRGIKMIDPADRETSDCC